MKKLALPLGLTAVFFSFVFSRLIGQLLAWLSAETLGWLGTPLAIAISFFAAFKLAPRMQADEAPPRIIQAVTLAAAGYFLLIQVSQAVGRTEGWSLVIATLGVLFFLKPRSRLLVGLTAFATRLQGVLLLSFFTSRLPDWVQLLITLVIAFLVARWLSQGQDSPADRVRKPIRLWCFGAAGAVVMIITARSILFDVYTEQGIWLLFLVSFVLMVDSIEPVDSGHELSPPSADYGVLFMMFIALYSTVATVFNVHGIVTGKIPFMGHDALRIWLPLLISVSIALAIMIFLRLGSRMRPDARARRTLRWGVILFFACVLAGGSIFGATAREGRVVDVAVVFVYTAILVLPLMVAAQILMSVGLLRVLFHLEARQR